MHGYIGGLFATFSSYGAFYYVFLIMRSIFAPFFAVAVANFGIAPPPHENFCAAHGFIHIFHIPIVIVRLIFLIKLNSFRAQLFDNYILTLSSVSSFFSSSSTSSSSEISMSLSFSTRRRIGYPIN